MTIRIGVLASETSWHFQDLKRASNAFGGNVQVRPVDFTTLESFVDQREEKFADRHGSIDGLDVLLVRTMPAGSLQQIVFRMDVLHRLAASGVRIVNSPRSVEIAIDKYLSLSLMANAGIGVPEFAVCQSGRQGLAAFHKLGGDVVLKPIFGSMGKHIQRLQEAETALDAMKTFVEKGEVVYLQKFVNHGGRDIRILIIGDKVFSMRRVNPNGGWLTNISCGSVAERYTATAAEIEVARMAARVNDCIIAGVDIVYDQDGGEPLVFEVNASPGWEAIQTVTNCDIAAEVLRLVSQAR